MLTYINDLLGDHWSVIETAGSLGYLKLEQMGGRNKWKSIVWNIVYDRQAYRRHLAFHQDCTHTCKQCRPTCMQVSKTVHRTRGLSWLYDRVGEDEIRMKQGGWILIKQSRKKWIQHAVSKTSKGILCGTEIHGRQLSSFISVVSVEVVHGIRMSEPLVFHFVF